MTRFDVINAIKAKGLIGFLSHKKMDRMAVRPKQKLTLLKL